MQYINIKWRAKYITKQPKGDPHSIGHECRREEPSLNGFPKGEKSWSLTTLYLRQGYLSRAVTEFTTFIICPEF